jgi:DNA-directed RNA polymerase specialized sigma subunit
MEAEQEITEEMIAKYIESLTEQERLVMEIAKEHLQSSFDVVKSIGFKKWLSEQK